MTLIKIITMATIQFKFVIGMTVLPYVFYVQLMTTDKFGGKQI